MQIQSYDTVCESFEAMVKGLSRSDLPKPTRSTVPFLCYWKGYPKRLPQLCGKLNVRMTDEAVLSFEHRVPSLNSRATPSHTDLMVITPDAAIAIEGKWTEGMYDVVNKWIAKGDYPNSRRRVVKHWLKLIQPFTKTVLSVETLPKDAVVYQLLHRTASACAVAGKTKNAIVLYQVFSDGQGKHPDYLKMFQPLTEYLKAGDMLSFKFMESQMEPAAAFGDLLKKCQQKSAEDSAAIIQAAILEADLFNFKNDILS